MPYSTRTIKTKLSEVRQEVKGPRGQAKAKAAIGFWSPKSREGQKSES